MHIQYYKRKVNNRRIPIITGTFSVDVIIVLQFKQAQTTKSGLLIIERRVDVKK